MDSRTGLFTFLKVSGAGVQRIGNVSVIASSPDLAARSVCELAVSLPAAGMHVHLVNAYSVALADRHHEFRRYLQGDAISLPDGKPLSWVSLLRRDSPRVRQIRGPQFFLDVIDRGREYRLRHYLLGSTEEVLAQIRSNIDGRFPGAEIVGSFSPPFRTMTPAEYAAQDKTIINSRAHIVWVGLGTPKQDREAQRLSVTVGAIPIAVGAAFDFAAGSRNEAPKWMISAGIEWVHRLCSEPRRLWRRYLFGNSRFIKSVIQHWAKTP